MDARTVLFVLMLGASAWFLFYVCAARTADAIARRLLVLYAVMAVGTIVAKIVTGPNVLSWPSALIFAILLAAWIVTACVRAIVKEWRGAHR